ncbi:MAG TPA: BamA/TamA family outer membrane protein [Burkholderiales bacterium]|nr:BamA/TamA family outer membrane protein [Burkholderiales bacterium]
MASSLASRISRRRERSRRHVQTAARSALIVALALLALGGTARAEEGGGGTSEPAGQAPLAAKPGYRLVIEAPDEVRRTLERGLSLARWQDDAAMTETLLRRLVDEARPEIVQALNAEGWFSPRVETAVEYANGGLIARIKVDPGEPTRVSAVALRFSGPVAAADPWDEARRRAVRRAFGLQAGARFTQAAWEAAKQRALAALAAERYAAASIAASEARIDPETRSAALSVAYDSGPPFYIGTIEVSGTRRIPARLVEHFNPLRAGEPWSRERVSLYERRLVESGYFVGASVEIDPDPARAAAAPLRVRVIEGRSQRITGGLGYSTDVGVRGNLNYSHSDLPLFSQPWRLRSSLRADSKTQTLEGVIDGPPRPNATWDSYGGSLERNDIQNEKTLGARLGYAYNWGLERNPSRIGLEWRVEQREIAGLPDDNRYAVFLGWRKTLRETDDFIDPTRGYLGSIELGSAIPGLATQNFQRALATMNFFVPAGQRDDLQFRAQAGYVRASTREGIPSAYVFRTGGDQTVRGYAYESIGVPEAGAIVGGRYLAVGSAEYIRWLTPEWGAAAFVDAGDAFDDFSTRAFKVGYGLGARWRSPIGPFRIDLAYGQQAHSLRVHFSAGFSF